MPRTDVDRTLNGLQVLTALVGSLPPDTQICSATVDLTSGNLHVHIYRYTDAATIAESLGLGEAKITPYSDGGGYYVWTGRYEGMSVQVVTSNSTSARFT